MHAVLLGKSLDQTVPVLPNTLHEVTGDADVESAVSFAGENINGRLLHGPIVIPAQAGI
jgi:hypothetical protein